MIIVNNIPLNETLMNILLDVQSQLTNGKLKDIIDGGEDIRITCPFHNDGREKTASCFVRKDDALFHCFGCGEKGGIGKLIASCMNISYKDAEAWLINKYGSDISSEVISLEPIRLNEIELDNDLIDESILSTLESYHPYMKQRKISDEIIKKYELKYDPKDQSIVFPVRNELGQLVGLTRRNVNYKRFELWKFRNKPVYLLYDILRNNIRHVVVCEGQIDALVSWSYGVPAIALFGAGTTDYQLNLLRKSGIISYVLMYDNDEAGRRGAERFKKYMKGAFITDIIMPKGIDVAACEKSQFYDILIKNNAKYIISDSQINK